MSQLAAVVALLSLPAAVAATGPGPGLAAGVRQIPPASDFDPAGYRGRIVVVNFWATWCLPCRQEIPHLVELDRRYDERLQVIGISVDRQGSAARVQEQVRRFARRLEIEYPLYIDHDLVVVKRFGDFTGIPRTFVLDRQGRAVHVFDGAVQLDDLLGVVEPLIEDDDAPEAGLAPGVSRGENRR